MDGASRAFPVPAEVTLCDKTYKLSPRYAQHLAELEDYVLTLKPDPVEVLKQVAASTKDPVALDAILRVGYEQACKLRSVSNVEMYEFMHTRRGLAYMTFLAMREDGPEDLTPERVGEMIMEEMESMATGLMGEGLSASDAALAAKQQLTNLLHSKLNRASGEDFRGNSTGSPPTPSEEESTKEASTESSGQ
jgi:hypothetical protein